MIKSATDWLDDHRDLGILFLRLFIGMRLIYGVLDNVVRWEDMIRFRNFLQSAGFPLPLVSAVVSVYAQLIAGIMIVFGWGTRAAALLMIIHFLVAFFMIHLHQSFEDMTPSLAMLFCNVLFLFYGAGKFKVGSLYLQGGRR